jgi:hypothetical protein
MWSQDIQEGYEVFVADTARAFGAVRQVRPQGRQEAVIYVENGGEFTVPFDAIKAVHAQKVIVDAGKLPEALRRAIGHAHDAEDPRLG